MPAAAPDCSPLALYAAALHAVATGARPLGWTIRYADGQVRPLELDRWFASRYAGDDALLDRCAAPTLDIGCGPGRLVTALCARRVPALGIDIAATVVRRAAATGVPVLHRSVFDRVPGTGRWGHTLLVDGNVGIGGDPARLLRRVRELLAPGGSLLCELDPPGTPAGPVRLRIESPAGRVSAWFGWAHVPPGELPALAAAAGLRRVEQWRDGGRWFAEVRSG